MKQLDIGCGNTITAGYLRADIDPNCPDLDYVCPMDAVPVDDNTFDRVRASHCIEHVSIEGAVKALQEWYRILKPGGVVWIDTPNIERNIDLYQSNDWLRDFATLTPEEQERCSLQGLPNKALWLNFKVFSTDSRYNTHYANYTPDLLAEMCLAAGFRPVTVIQLDPSLIVEAVK